MLIDTWQINSLSLSLSVCDSHPLMLIPG